MLGVTLLQRLQNETIRTRLGFKKSMIDTIQMRQLKWFGNVVRRHPEAHINRVFNEDFMKKRPPGRPKKQWSDQF